MRETRATTFGDARNVAANLVPTEDQDRFASMLMRELHIMHEGNIARYGVRLPEFRAWKESVKNP